MTKDYKETLFLPHTTFTLHGKMQEREENILAFWKECDLYEKVRMISQGRKKFVLHDGPPYANGTPHMGHALNRILKDTIVRLYQMSGWDAAFVPGWDCHGLPIEWKVEENFRKQGRSKESVPLQEFRTACDDFAHHWIGIQKEAFRRMGICADWDNPYITTDPKVEAVIIRELGQFLLSGALYQGERPVLWSTVEQTALAEAEVEYFDKTSTSLYVAFPVATSPLSALKGAYCAIWTTTPWTLPANRAIAYNKDIDYCVAAFDTLHGVGSDVSLVVAEACLTHLEQALETTASKIVTRFKGKALENTICHHPWKGKGYDFAVPLLYGQHVNTEVGTGLVHTAPSHGVEDFEVGCQFGLEVPKLVTETGLYTEATPLFAGKSIFKVDTDILTHLTQAQCLLAQASICHSFPHSWRSKAPLIFRTTPQWFISLDKTDLRKKALQAIEDVKWIPAQGYNRIKAFVENRADWCISRQRIWGVPLAIFVNKKSGDPLRDQAVIERTAHLVEEHGSAVWFTESPQAFLGEHYNAEDFTQIFDIVDVWFESGCSHAYTLETRTGLRAPADLYLEGSDQHRGWFQSSLLESIGTRERAPYRTVLTHGFLLDEEGRKMSKSSDNGVDPMTIITQQGADILRLWVLSSDFKEDVRIGGNILKQQEDLYKRLRNTVRYLLGNLQGFKAQEAVSYTEMPALERWVLHRLKEIEQSVARAREIFDLNTLLAELHTFCANDLSAFYFDIRKDCLYCDSLTSPKRRACRTVLDQVFETLVRWLAPLIPFLAEEAWQIRQERSGQSICETTFISLPEDWRDETLGKQWQTVKALRRVLTGALEVARAEGKVRSSLAVTLEVFDPDKQFPESVLPDLADVAIVSQAQIRHEAVSAHAFTLQEVPAFGVHVHFAEGAKCARCWKIQQDVDGDLCPRCQAVVCTGEFLV
ncbi:MAG: isoleucine--tRNA ligase [Holosporales bacterium]|jgi:isoleucyl-tRNA synthetase|nr:isoleucine--tRNA ligase [Holosporales bacterium]